MNRRAVFLDLNGTLVLPVKPERLDDLVAIPGASHAVARLVAAGFACPVVTAQSRIAKGHFSAADFHRWFEALARTWSACGALIDDPYLCPHRFAEPCSCKKPNTLLYEAARFRRPGGPRRASRHPCRPRGIGLAIKPAKCLRADRRSSRPAHRTPAPRASRITLVEPDDYRR